MNRFKGIVLSDGIGIGRVLLLDREGTPLRMNGNATDPDTEIAKLSEAIAEVSSEYTGLIDETIKTVNEKEADIFKAQSMLLFDEDFLTEVKRRIREENVSAEYAVFYVGEEYARRLEESGETLISERGADVKDVCLHIIDRLWEKNKSLMPNGPFVLLSNEVFPTEFITYKSKNLKGIIVKKGSFTAHVSILARASHIPMILVEPESFELLKAARDVIIDCKNKIVISDADETVIYTYLKKTEKISAADKERNKDLVRSLKSGKTSLYANISSAEEAEEKQALDYDGIGLFRTEYLYMGDNPPSEDEQFEEYRRALKAFAGKPVTIRTFDFGGDRKPPYLRAFIEEHANLRGIRLAILEENLLITQLKALLRASVYGKLNVCIPMVKADTDVENVNNLILRASVLLEKEGYVKNAPGIPVTEKVYGDFNLGVMIETIRALNNLCKLSKVSGFFSIGTNDLTSELTGRDRFSDTGELSKIEKAGLVREISKIVREGKAAGIPVGICGEIAADSWFSKFIGKLACDYISISGEGQ